jgi:hypothetical protein
MENTVRDRTRQPYQRAMFPSIPDDARIFLRKPLQRWRRATHRYLGSARDWRDDIEFGAEILAIRIGYRSCPDAWLGVMCIGLKRELDSAGTGKSPGCPCRHTCALLDVLKKLFGDVPPGDGAPQPQESGTGLGRKGPA